MSLASEGFGGPTGALAAELHLKMSKKIAQLTKVIFHLNTRNEDFQTASAHAKHTHARELAQLTQDAAAKLRQLHEQLQAQSSATQLAERRVESERQQAQHELAQLQRSTRAVDQRVREHVAQLEAQVQAAERAFSDRTQQLVRIAEAQQQSASLSASAALAAARSAHEADVAALVAKKDDEVTQLVTASNAKYNEMLAVQLRAQDALRDAAAASVAALEQQLERETSELAAQAAVAATAARAQFDEMTHRLVSKMETVLADAEQLRGREATLRAEKETLVQTQSELQRRLKQLELQVSHAQLEVQSVRQDADAHAQHQQQLFAAATKRVDELTHELQTLTTTLQTRDEALRQTQQALAAAQLETLERSVSLSEKDALLVRQTQERELQLADLRTAAQVSQQQRTLAETALQSRIRTLEALTETAARELSDVSAKLVASEQQRTRLQTALADWKAKGDESDRRTQQLAQQIERERAELETAHMVAIQRQQSEADARFHALELQLQQRSKESLANGIAQLTSDHAKVLRDLKAASDAEQQTLTHEVARLTAQLKTAQSETAAAHKEIGALRASAADVSAQLKREQEKLASVLSDKEMQLKASERGRKEKEDALVKQIRDLGDQRETATKKFAAEKEQLQLQHSQTLTALAREHEGKLTRLREAWEAQTHAQLASQTHELTDQYERREAALRSDLLALQTQHEREARDAQETQRAALESRSLDQEGYIGSLLRLRSQLESQRQREAEAAERQLQTLRAQHAEELAALNVRLASECRQLLTSANEAAELRVAQLQASHHDTLERTSQQHVKATNELRTKLETTRRNELLALRTETAQQTRDLAAQKDRERADALREAHSRHDAAVGVLETQVEQLQRALAQKGVELSSNERANEQLGRALDAKAKDAAERVAALERASREQVETLKQAAKQDMDRLLEENLAETKLLSDQFEETRLLMADKVTRLKQAVAEWEERYARRESRPEDVSRLAELGRLVAEKDALVRQTLDEMAYFKRELLNREEMYNKTFARAPNVGVLNVLKPHVQLQAQLLQGGLGVGGGAAPQTKRKTKPAHAGSGPEAQAQELQRRNSERAASSGGGVKKSLPPLQNNQVAL